MEGEREAEALRRILRGTVETTPGAILEYAAVVDPGTFEEAEGRLPRALALVAARVGGTRLIDNQRLDVDEA